MKQQKIDIKKIVVQEIIMRAIALKDKHTKEYGASIDYVYIYSQSEKEYQDLIALINTMGMEFYSTNTGPFYELEEPIKTPVVNLKYIKIRRPYSTHPERGHADFLVADYPAFKKENIGRENFKLMKRENYEMLELTDTNFNVRVYFPDRPTAKRLGILKP